jgi:pseudouridine-5'-phosphate glycosidase
MNQFLNIAPEVIEAIQENRPVVALESTIIAHGMAFPQNAETALAVEKIIRDEGAVPATIAVRAGKLKVGLSPTEIETLARNGAAIAKLSTRDLPHAMARRPSPRPCGSQHLPASGSLRRAALAACIGAPPRPSTSRPISAKWP